MEKHEECRDTLPEPQWIALDQWPTGVPHELIARVESILRKRGLGRDPEVQTFEDALCLTFLETQLVDFTKEHHAEKARSVLSKTLMKMSPAARDIARGLDLPDSARTLVREAMTAIDR